MEGATGSRFRNGKAIARNAQRRKGIPAATSTGGRRPQTAEGALSETHSILQRMRELAVQAANDTYTSQDRQNIQQEIDQLTAEIDRSSSATQIIDRHLRMIWKNTRSMICLHISRLMIYET